MPLIRLVYASQFASPISEQDAQDIIEISTVNNRKHDITGVLCDSNFYYLQCLEGGRDEVNHLYQKIAMDKRHVRPVILMYQEILHREFDDWYMGRIPAINISGAMVLKYSREREFNPYTMTPESAYQFLFELSRLNAVL
ncbi:BLUF domain-containing protein [Agitococcus lubricus]|uniref:FAD-dependent sensor of blue light n=1 Tax=Agitococcus lubricus TaxID=1077255 RepID=A0A2T5IUE9_9GAMM|nr:BLUF domain-containing protein [Agitococcus lubricus]PTQ87525.1 FAD-dependent sensor of blue light [Agitococcus lubricus]